MTFALFGSRHMQVLLEQLNVPDGQSPTEAHSSHWLATHTGVDPEHEPQV
jgi:hypothetical protein